MPKIDVHTHILPESLPSSCDLVLEHHRPGCARMMRGGALFREIYDNCWDPEARLAECDAHDVSAQVLSTIPVLFGYGASARDALEASRYLNDHIASVVARAPSRFVGLATVPMQAPDLAVRELERAVRELGLAGVEIGSNVNGKNLDAPEVVAVLEAAEALDAAVFVHPWEMLGRDRMPKYWLPWLVGMPAETSLAICSMIFGGVFEKLPRLRVLFAHGGGAFPATLGRIQRGYDVRPDLCAVDNPKGPREYLGRFYVDALVHDAALLRYTVDLLGASRVALGTDYPFPLGEREPGALIASAGFDAEATEHLLWKTACQWLGIDGVRFAS